MCGPKVTPYVGVEGEIALNTCNANIRLAFWLMVTSSTVLNLLFFWENVFVILFWAECPQHTVLVLSVGGILLTCDHCST